jgi:hypothetical protein
MKKKLFLLACPIALFLNVTAQTVYDNFEHSPEHVTYPFNNGQLSTGIANPDTNVNKSAKCARYIRKYDVIYDNIKMVTDSAFDIHPYLKASATKFITLMVRTNDTISRRIQIQVGKTMGSTATDTSFTQSIYAWFEATTTPKNKNKWEMLTFKYVDFNKSYDTTKNPITGLNKLVMQFSPNDTSKIKNDTLYFDNLTGPSFNGLPVLGMNRVELSSPALQLYPNPASSSISVRVASPSGNLSIRMMDVLGRTVLQSEEIHSGEVFTKTYSLEGLRSGMYYVQVQSGEWKSTEKIIIQ